MYAFDLVWVNACNSIWHWHWSVDLYVLSHIVSVAQRFVQRNDFKFRIFILIFRCVFLQLLPTMPVISPTMLCLQCGISFYFHSFCHSFAWSSLLGFFVFVNQRRFSIWHRVVVSVLPLTKPKTLCCQLFSSIVCFVLFIVCFSLLLCKIEKFILLEFRWILLLLCYKCNSHDPVQRHLSRIIYQKTW